MSQKFIEGRDNRRVGLLASLAALMVQPVVFYWRVLIHPLAHIPYDVELYYFPVIAWMARCVRHGWAPFWDPYTYAGMPLYGDLQAQLFYPPTWAAMLAGNLSGGANLYYWVEWLVPLHMIAAGLFAFLLARRMGLCAPAALMGASIYQLGGYFASQATHLGAICAGAWLPLSILAVFEMRRGFRPRWFAALVLAASMAILSGFAATTAIIAGATILFAFALLASREAGWRVLSAVVAAWTLAALVAAVQLIPLWTLTGLSIASVRSAWLTAWGAPVESLVSLARPNYYHIFEALTPQYKLPYNFTFLYVYCGIVPMVLMLAAPFVRGRARLFFALTVASAIWMLGEHTPVYRLAFEHTPGLVRGGLYAWYAMMAFCLFAGLTAAIVLDRAGRRVPQALLWIVALLTGWDLIHAGRDRPMNTAEGSYRLSSSEYQYQGDPEALRKLHALVGTVAPPMRIDYADIWAPGILGASMLELPTADGNTPFMLNRMHALRLLFCANKPSDPMPLPTRDLPVTRFDSPLLRMLNVGILASLWELPADQVKEAGLTPVMPVGGLYLYRVPAPLPRFFLAPRVRRSAGEAETFRWLAEPSFNPAEAAIVEGVPADRAGLAAGTVQVNVYEPDRVHLSVVTDGPAFLATSEALYPGWEATVNGKQQPMFITNGVFRGLDLPAGKSDVIMAYRPAHLALSITITLLAVATTIAIGTRARAV